MMQRLVNLGRATCWFFIALSSIIWAVGIIIAGWVAFFAFMAVVIEIATRII